MQTNPEVNRQSERLKPEIDTRTGATKQKEQTMSISETKMQMVIDNYFDECDVNTSIRQAFEKGFRIGVKKGASMNRPQGEWIMDEHPYYETRFKCSNCGESVPWDYEYNIDLVE